MNLKLSEKDRSFQREVRDWLSLAWPKEMRDKQSRSALEKLSKKDLVDWQKRLAEKGWAGANWPKEHGGAAFTPTQNYIFDLERARVGAPGVIPFGISMVAPVIMKFGSDLQKENFLPKILNSDIWFCQGYSEPGSGSDLASLNTKAEDKGDHYLINGTKTWTTMAQYADWMFCLVRTSSEDIPQKGISFLLIDMKSAGISVKPIVTLDQPSEGFQEINMVYLENVEVPKENLIGEEGKGWTCAKYLLEFERGNAYSPALKGALAKLKNMIKQAPSDLEDNLSTDKNLLNKLSTIEVEVLALEYTELRILGSLAAGQNVGPESSLLKTRGTELQQSVTEFFAEMVGMSGLPLDQGTPADGDNYQAVGKKEFNGVMQDYFNTRKVSIYAGSNEIQRNIMSKMVLGL